MFACLYIPDFSVQASLLPDPAERRTVLSRSPIAILDGPANLPRVFAANPAARRAGIRTGMTKLQAEICSGIELRKRSLDEEKLAHATLLECAAMFSPRVESSCPGVAILDLAGTEKLFCRPQKSPTRGALQKDWRQTDIWTRAVQIIVAKVSEAGVNVRIATAINPDTALLAARGFSQNTIVPAGREASYLAALPVEILPLSPEMLDTLGNWGIRTFQSLAALPEVAIVERLGQQGLYLQKLTRCEIARPLIPVESQAEFAESFEFDDPIETLESIFFILNRLLHQLCFRLLSISQAASALRLAVGLNVRQIHRGKNHTPIENAIEEETVEHEWKLPIPTQDKNLLFGLVRLHLEKTTFSAPIRFLRIAATAVKPRLAQGNLFAPPSPEPEKLEITQERIRGVVGDLDAEGVACVGSPRLLDTHKPGSFSLDRFAPSSETYSYEQKVLPRPASTPGSEQPSVSHAPGPTIALRIFRPPFETAVEFDGQKPHFVRLWSRHRRVLAASGPWSTSGNWWNVSAWAREEWDVALKMPAGVGFYRIYHDRLGRQWYVEGVFD